MRWCASTRSESSSFTSAPKLCASSECTRQPSAEYAVSNTCVRPHAEMATVSSSNRISEIGCEPWGWERQALSRQIGHQPHVRSGETDRVERESTRGEQRTANAGVRPDSRHDDLSCIRRKAPCPGKVRLSPSATRLSGSQTHPLSYDMDVHT